MVLSRKASDNLAKYDGQAAMNVFTSDEFRCAFIKAWDECTTHRAKEISEKYKDNKSWTEFMLGESGLLRTTMRYLDRSEPELKYWREWYTIDAIYTGGAELITRKGSSYPSKLHVLIEHENGDNVEEEMYKLIFWRSPLKVIIFYDWHEYQKITEDKKNWLDQKLQHFIAMLDSVNAYFPENNKTSYLFIIGNREAENHLPQWKCASNKNRKPFVFIGGKITG